MSKFREDITGREKSNIDIAKKKSGNSSNERLFQTKPKENAGIARSENKKRPRSSSSSDDSSSESDRDLSGEARFSSEEWKAKKRRKKIDVRRKRDALIEKKRDALSFSAKKARTKFRDAETQMGGERTRILANYFLFRMMTKIVFAIERLSKTDVNIEKSFVKDGSYRIFDGFECDVDEFLSDMADRLNGNLRAFSYQPELESYDDEYPEDVDEERAFELALTTLEEKGFVAERTTKEKREGSLNEDSIVIKNNWSV